MYSSNTKKFFMFYIDVALPVPLRKTFVYLPLDNTNITDYQQGIRVQVPFGTRMLIGVVEKVFESREQLPTIASSKLKKIKKILDKDTVIPHELLELIEFAAKYYHHYIGEVYGACLPKSLREGGEIGIFNNRLVSLNADSKFIKNTKKLSKPQQRLIDILDEHNDSLSMSSLHHLGVKDSTIDSLAKNNWIYIKEVPKTEHNSFGKENQINLLREPLLTLNNEQKLVVASICSNIDQFKTFLLYGITGSGKTEVYLQVIYTILQRKQQVLVLVPEISLTPQTVNRFKHRFNTKIAVIHSKVSVNNKAQDWLAAKDGSAKIIIGTRSSIFTPVKDLGLIIIDEEHDVSFKQQEGFRYNGRDLAIIRAKRFNIPVILGSATPSIESIANVLYSKYELLKLTKRAGASKLPKIKLLNIIQQKLKAGLSEELIHQMNIRLKNNQQVLLFLNRRGYAPVLKCHDCNWGGICQRCNVYYTVHKQDSSLVCHYCMSYKKLPLTCPDCGSIDLANYGVGTEQIEEYLTDKFKKYPCVRIDRDTTRKKGELDNLLERVHQNKPMILLGTQMLAKGHHFPSVTMVAILDVDSSLFSTDFRAPERILQLLIQVSGRAGRADISTQESEVIIQTSQPEHKVLQDLLRRDYWDIATELYEVRRLAQQPPYAAWVLLRAECYDLNKTMNFLNQVKNLGEKLLMSIPEKSLKLLGPILAPRVKKAGLLRGQLLISSVNRKEIHVFVNRLLEQISDLDTSSIRWSLDVDPQDVY